MNILSLGYLNKFQVLPATSSVINTSRINTEFKDPDYLKMRRKTNDRYNNEEYELYEDTLKMTEVSDHISNKMAISN